MQKLQLTIPEPCHQNWQHMHPTEQGRFCNACAKEVIDFSMMTDMEVLNYFTIFTHENICGRALPDQLNRTISQPKEPKKRLFWYWNYIVMFLMFFSKTNTAKAQGEIKAGTEIRNTPACRVGENLKSSSWVISGKVIDKEGHPASFVSIKIKGSNAGFSADANGGYAVKVKQNDILVISGVGFKTAEEPVGKTTLINTVLEKVPSSKLGEVIVTVAGGMRRRNPDEKNTSPSNQKYIAVFEVKDDKSMLPVDKAKIFITKNYSNDPDIVFTDNRGMYELKKIKGDDVYYIKVEAAGYETNEFTVNGNDFNDRKKGWEIFIGKQKVEVSVKVMVAAKPGYETKVRLGQVGFTMVGAGVLYVVDGTILSGGTADIHPDDVDNISILHGPEAIALFGPDGSQGAIIITTRKNKVKNLDTVAVSTVNNSLSGRLGGVRVRTTIKGYREVKTRIKTILSDSLKIYPNPVQRGDQINISLKLKQTGSHNFQITDATGRIFLQKQFNTVAKECTEKIQTDNRWSSGVYYIRVFDINNKLVSKNNFMIQ